MESSLKNLFFRRRSKSKPPAGGDVPQQSFQQTSSYAAVSSGPAPKVGTLPLKPSQEKQPRKSFSHTKAKSDGLQETRQMAESANVGRPRTAPGLKPHFVGVSKPASSGIPSATSSRGTSIDIVAGEDSPPPPVPPLPKDLDSLRGPRYHDIMQFAAQQQISRATFNEHVATRNMGLPRKSVDIFETQVNQLSSGRYNEYVAMRNIDLPRQSIDRLEEEIALYNATVSDTQRTSFDAMRATREGLRHQSRSNSVDKAPNKPTGQAISGLGTYANTQSTRIVKDRPLKAGDDDHTSGSDATANATASRWQVPQSSRVASHSRKHSLKQNHHLGELSSIPQSRTADFMPPEWLSYGNTKTAWSSDGRTRSMTAAIPSRYPNDGRGTHNYSSPGSTREDQKSPPQTFWNARNQISQHNASRSLSVLEGLSEREAFRSATPKGIQSQLTEPNTHHKNQSPAAGNTLTGKMPQDVSQGATGSDTSSRRSSMVMSTTSSVMKRIESSGRRIMDLTDEGANSSTNNAGHPIYHELSGEPQQRVVYFTDQIDLSRKTPEPLTTHATEQHTVSEMAHPESYGDPEAISSRVEKSDGHDLATIPRGRTEAAIVTPTAVVGAGPQNDTSESTSRSATVSSKVDSPLASIHSQATIPLESTAGNSAQQDAQVIDQDDEARMSRQSEQVYATPESLKSNDFKDPSRAFGVTARDFAVSPTHRQRSDMPKKTAHPQESTLDKTTPLLTTKLPAGQEKVVHHISSFTLPAKQPKIRQSSRDQIAFDEDAFQRKQTEARAALLKLERDLQENFTFGFDSLNKPSVRDAPDHFRDLSLEEGGLVAPISRFSSVHAPTSVYQNKRKSGTSQADARIGERSPQRGTSIPALATTGGSSIAGVHSMPRNSKRNSLISTISETNAEPQPNSAPAPTTALSSASDRGRSMTSRPPAHGRMHSTASTASSASAFSVPPHMVPERTSSMRDSEVPPFSIDDARWE